MTRDWAVTLPEKYNRRFEDDSLVIWRPGFTIWTIIWNNNNRKTPQERLEWIRRDASSDAFEAEILTEGGIIHYAYRLTEPREEGVVHAFYAFAIGAEGHVQMAIYFDDESELEIARRIWRSLDETPTT